MLIWINGAFGAGKTQTAGELQRRLPGSFIADPERLGRGIHGMQPPALRGDFQDDPVWAPGVASILGRLDDAMDAPVIVPMTLTDAGRFDQIVGGLRGYGHDVRHVSLLADAATVRRRVSTRTPQVREWVADHFDAAQAALSQEKFGAHVQIGERSIPQVAEAVADVLALELGPGESRPWRQLVDQVRTGLRYR